MHRNSVANASKPTGIFPVSTEENIPSVGRWKVTTSISFAATPLRYAETACPSVIHSGRGEGQLPAVEVPIAFEASDGFTLVKCR
ncbi:MAG: hypothetical protein ACLS4S_05040 [Bacteroides nordii]